jgi:hypothetical protein
MCDPTVATVLTLTSTAIEAGGAIAQNRAQAKASKANDKAAKAALHDTWRDLGARQVEEQAATSATILDIDRNARSLAGQAAVSAGEAGVAGASVDALLGDIAGQAGDARNTARRNLTMTLDELQREKVAAKATAQSRSAGVPMPNPFLTGLQIVSSGVNAGTELLNQRNPRSRRNG